jgi:ribosome-binding factor A
MAHSEKRSRDGFARDAGIRSLRLEELFREELNLLLDGEVNDPRLDGTRITRVELTRDGSSARVWFAMRPNDEGVSPDDARAAFEHAAGFLRSRLCDSVSLKRIPDLRFRHDPIALDPPFSNPKTR